MDHFSPSSVPTMPTAPAMAGVPLLRIETPKMPSALGAGRRVQVTPPSVPRLIAPAAPARYSVLPFCAPVIQYGGSGSFGVTKVSRRTQVEPPSVLCSTMPNSPPRVTLVPSNSTTFQDTSPARKAGPGANLKPIVGAGSASRSFMTCMKPSSGYSV